MNLGLISHWMLTVACDPRRSLQLELCGDLNYLFTLSVAQFPLFSIVIYMVTALWSSFSVFVDIILIQGAYPRFIRQVDVSSFREPGAIKTKNTAYSISRLGKRPGINDTH